MSELSKARERFIDSLNLFSDIKSRVEGDLTEIVKQVQLGYDGYVAFNDETEFPYYYDDSDDKAEAIVAVRVRKADIGNSDVLEFTTNVEVEDEDSWFCPFDYGEFDYEMLYSCVLNYAELHEID